MSDSNNKDGWASDFSEGNRITDQTISRVASRETPYIHSRLNREDIEEQANIVTADNASDTSSNELEPTATSDKIILSFSDDDPENPYSWSIPKKSFVLSVSILCVMNSTVSSGLASNSSSFFGADFNITSNTLLVLPTSIFLLGYVVGPVFYGPLSEQYGRKYVMVYAFFFFTVWTMASALAPSFAALVVFRFLCGVGAACPIVVVGGTCADIFRDPVSRGRAMAVFMGATTFGPCAGPVISGYISPPDTGINWRWSFWVGLIFAGVTLIPLLLVPETYAPVLLKRRAQKMRKETGNPKISAPMELEKEDLKHIVSKVLTRPIRMFIFEPIVLFSSLYLSFVYGVFYMLFQAYPFVYIDTYSFTLGQEGLTFLSIGIGACIAIIFYLYWDHITARARATHKPWVAQEEMRRLPLACLAGPFFVVSCLWLGWSARPDVHWMVPVSSGVFFGIGYLLVFMALLNYLVDAYKIFAASAMAAASASRSLFGAVLPFAARPMYESLGVPWACTLLALLSLVLAVIPFVFIWKGEVIRSRSEFCQYLAKREVEEEEKRRRREARARRGGEGDGDGDVEK